MYPPFTTTEPPTLSFFGGGGGGEGEGEGGGCLSNTICCPVLGFPNSKRKKKGGGRGCSERNRCESERGEDSVVSGIKNKCLILWPL